MAFVDLPYPERPADAGSNHAGIQTFLANSVGPEPHWHPRCIQDVQYRRAEDQPLAAEDHRARIIVSAGPTTLYIEWMSPHPLSPLPSVCHYSAHVDEATKSSTKRTTIGSIMSILLLLSAEQRVHKAPSTTGNESRFQRRKLPCSMQQRVQTLAITLNHVPHCCLLLLVVFWHVESHAMGRSSPMRLRRKVMQRIIPLQQFPVLPLRPQEDSRVIHFS